MEPIVIEHLSKQYGKLLAVNDLSWAVERGVFVGFLGPNGAGKTTTIKMLTNLLRATNGKAYLNGVDVIRHPKAALDRVGAVVETPEFYPQLTPYAVSYTHLRAHETRHDLVCRLLLEKKK